jgi:DNA invertase Pin-like site-specific DNA recombinase
MEDARARKFECLLVWKLDPFGRCLVDCLNNIQELERYGVRFVAVTQNLDADEKNPASRFLLHVLGAATEFERSLNQGKNPSWSATVPSRLRCGEGGEDRV